MRINSKTPRARACSPSGTSARRILPMGEEVELKLEVAEGAAERLLGQPWLSDGFSQEQCSVYFDTPDSSLRGRGYTLRVRTVGGRFIQTVKSLDGGAGLFERGEWEYEIELP